MSGDQSGGAVGSVVFRHSDQQTLRVQQRSDDRSQFIVDEQKPRAAVSHGIGDLGRCPPRVEWHHDAARPEDGVKGFHVMVAIDAQQGDSIAGAQPKRMNARSQPGDAPLDLAPPARPAGADRCGARRMKLARPREALRQLHISMLASRAHNVSGWGAHQFNAPRCGAANGILRNAMTPPASLSPVTGPCFV